MRTRKFMITAVLTFIFVASATAQKMSMSQEKESIIKIMKAYKSALENKTTEGTFELFSKDSEVYEQGGIEGTYANYIEHHLGPELSHFERFEFSDYTIEVEVGFPYAFTTETFVYTIELHAEEGDEPRIVKRKGVATSVLKKIDGDWKIIKMHSSSRNKK